MESLNVGQATRAKSSWGTARHAGLAGLARRAVESHQTMMVLAAEVGLAVLSYALAVFAISEASGRESVGDVLRLTIGPLVLLRLGALVSVQLYRRSLRYANLLDLISIAKAVSISSLLFWGFAWLEFGALKLPAAIFLFDWAFLQLLWGGLHFSGRIRRARESAANRAGKRVVLIGAGDAGMSLLKELTLDSSALCRPVGILDDDPEKWGNTVYGVTIEGGSARLPRIASETKADEIFICIPSATRAQMRALLSICRQTKLPVRTLPSVAELVDGRVSRRDLRAAQIEDFLQRAAIEVNPDETRKVVGGKVVLVTGAGGSIGSELCRQIARAEPAKLLLLDRSENSLFYINLEVTELLAPARVKPFLADLLHDERLTEILRTEKPEVIFHAAAHKHVGMLEMHPQEAIRNNVIGTRNIARAALECGVKQLVNISTDKAVSPRNYMGFSKKVTELCIQEFARAAAVRFSSVRFGNVAGSTGSVLRLFRDQIEKGEPIRVTDPRATRYFMSVPEAVHLILRAAALGKGGETFVFDMGEPLNIYDLARTMILFAGLRPHEDIPIEFTGLKEGEKIEEALWEEWEEPAATECERILAVRGESELSRGILEKIQKMEDLLGKGHREELLDYIHSLAPELNAHRARNAAHGPATAQRSAEGAAAWKREGAA